MKSLLWSNFCQRAFLLWVNFLKHKTSYEKSHFLLNDAMCKRCFGKALTTDVFGNDLKKQNIALQMMLITHPYWPTNTSKPLFSDHTSLRKQHWAQGISVTALIRTVTHFVNNLSWSIMTTISNVVIIANITSPNFLYYYLKFV